MLVCGNSGSGFGLLFGIKGEFVGAWQCLSFFHPSILHDTSA
jgi:hypothetical protein